MVVLGLVEAPQTLGQVTKQHGYPVDLKRSSGVTGDLVNTHADTQLSFFCLLNGET